MRLLIGLGVSLIVVVGAIFSFVMRPAPIFAETHINPARFSATGLVKAGKRLVAVGELGHILLSDDDGKKWSEAAIKDGRGSALTQVVFLNEKDGVAVGHDGWILFSEDGGLNWQESRFEKDVSEPLLGVWGLDGGPVFAFGSFSRFFVSKDRGRTWERSEPGSGDKHIYSMDGAKDGRMMLVGEHGLAMKSSDSGATWKMIPEFYRGTMFGVVRLSADEWLAYGLRGNVFVSRDFGETWQPVNTGVSVGLFGHYLTADGVVILVGQGGTILESRDRAASFQSLQSHESANLTAIIPLQGDSAVIAGLGGIKTLTSAKQGVTK